MSAAHRRWPDLSRTREALIEYDAGRDERDAMLHAVATSADVDAWQCAYHEALGKVQQAFWLDTQDRNNRANCSRLNEEEIRRMVAKWEAQTRNDEEAGHVR